MKKRFLFPLVAVGAFGAMPAIGTIAGPTESVIEANKAAIDRCIELKGDTDSCDKIETVNDKRYNPGEYYEKKFEALALRKSFKAEKAAKTRAVIAAHQKKMAEEAKKFKVTPTSVAMLALDCAQKHIRPYLKDPQSFRELGHGYQIRESENLLDIQVRYTATNGFGGRVQNSKICTYTM